MAKTSEAKLRRVRWLKALIAVFCFLVLGIGYVAASICVYGQRTADGPAEAAIVLGAAVWGEEPCPVFRERINHAIVLYRNGKVQKLLLTGGMGEDSRIAESEAAKRYAVQQGVPKADILTEDQSHSTFENLRYAQEEARKNRLRSFLIVSDPLHMKRAMDIANSLGLQAEPSPTPTTRYRTLPRQFGLLVRETYYYTGRLLKRFSKSPSGDLPPSSSLTPA